LGDKPAKGRGNKGTYSLDASAPAKGLLAADGIHDGSPRPEIGRDEFFNINEQARAVHLVAFSMSWEKPHDKSREPS
jgi:hypothetical protein